MKLKNVTADQLRAIVESVSANLYGGDLIFDREPETTGVNVVWIHFTLRTVTGRSPGARRTHQGRRLAKACWHAHRDVMQALFDAYPAAELHTALARYIGRDGFMTDFPATGDTQLGSVAKPIAMRDACDCSMRLSTARAKRAIRLEYAPEDPYACDGCE